MNLLVVVGAIAAVLVVGVVLARMYPTRALNVRAHASSPVQAAQRTKVDRFRKRASECELIEVAVRSSTEDRLEEGHFAGFETLAVDVWSDRDFTLRHRAVGLGWLPFVGKPEHIETPEITRGRLERAYRLNDDERQIHMTMQAADGGRIAMAAAIVAARIYQYPVWHSGLFDGVHARIDLVEEVTYLVIAAREIRDRFRLAQPPIGAMAADHEIVAVYVQKLNLLQRRLDALLDRLRALDDLRATVARVQAQTDKNEWLDRVGVIDDVVTGADAVADSLYAVDMRDRAKMAEAAAAIRFGPAVELRPLDGR